MWGIIPRMPSGRTIFTKKTRESRVKRGFRVFLSENCSTRGIRGLMPYMLRYYANGDILSRRFLSFFNQHFYMFNFQIRKLSSLNISIKIAAEFYYMFLFKQMISLEIIEGGVIFIQIKLLR